MAIEITMPQLSDTMDEGTILSWLKKEGDSVSRGDALAEVATDKADLEIESFHEGTLLKIHSPEGSTVKVGAIIAVIGEASEAIPSSSPTQPEPATQPEVATPAVSASSYTTNGGHSAEEPVHAMSAGYTSQAPVQQSAEHATERVKISPLAKNLASVHGVDYSAVSGSGDGGRIVKRDIEAQLGRTLSPQEVMQVVEAGTPVVRTSAPAPQVAPQVTVHPQAAQESKPQQQPAATPTAKQVATAAAAGESTEVLSKMRQTIAQRMVESVTTAPHFYVTAKVHVDKMMAMRQTLKSLPQYEGITVNHLVIKAAGLALAQFPRINSSYRDGAVVQPGEVNIGIITALPDGLLIPVIKRADTLPLADIVQESNGLVQRARSGRPKSEDLLGGTFSISNIGKSDVESFTAIINPGQGAILAVGSMQQEPVVVDGALAVGTVMRLTLSVDHRIIDGVLGGQFITELKRLLEEPVLLLA